MSQILIGGVQFLTDPIIKNLNSEPFERIVATTWFTDNASVNFSDSVKFGDVVLHKPITATVTIEISRSQIRFVFLIFCTLFSRLSTVYHWKVLANVI